MRKYTNKQYTSVFYKLPREIQDVVASPAATTDIIVKIGEKHKLQLDQIDTLINIVLDVLMGMTASKNMIGEIVELCAISRNDAGIIAREVDDAIFKPIKELMMKTYADGAPYKPDTLKTVEEKEYDSSHLHRDDLLKEIEDPAPSAKITVETNNKVALPKIESTQMKISDSKVLEEYHEEIEPKEKEEVKTDLRSSAPTGISSVEESKKRLLESIASKKLSGIFTMPAVEVGEGSLPKKIVVEEKIPISPTLVEKSVPKKEALAPANTPSSTDPYRESIK